MSSWKDQREGGYGTVYRPDNITVDIGTESPNPQKPNPILFSAKVSNVHYTYERDLADQQLLFDYEEIL